MPKTAGIVLVGNEILSGKIADANAAYLCRELRALGVDVRRISVIPDEIELIAHEVAAVSRAPAVVLTWGGGGPTQDDVTIEGVARAMDVKVVRHQLLVGILERHFRDRLNESHLKMAETPEGAELVGGETVRFPTVLIRNVYILPGVPEIFRQKFESIRERFRDQPIHLKNVFVAIGEGTLADYLNRLLVDFPLLLLGSYPEFSNPEYKVKVTLDVGAADGLLSRKLTDHGWRVTAIEGDPVLAQGGARHCERMITANLDREIPEGEGPFDVIVYGDVLEHLVDPLRVLVELDRSLAPTGFVVISVPNIAHLWIRLLLLFGRFEYLDRGILDHSHL